MTSIRCCLSPVSTGESFLKMENNKLNILETVKPSSLRKYFVEYVVIALVGCTVYLFLAFNNLNQFIRTQLITDKEKLIEVVQKNTEALNNSNRLK